MARGNKAAVLAAARDAEEGSVMIHNHPSGDLEPSDADLGVAGRLYEEGIGTAITNNDADRLFVVVEPPKPRVVEPLEIDRLEAVLVLVRWAGEETEASRLTGGCGLFATTLLDCVGGCIFQV